MQRVKFAFKLSDSPRDREIADWIERQLAAGFDVSEQIRTLLWEMITGQSSLTGRALVLNAAPPVATSSKLELDLSEDAARLLNFED